MSFAPNSKELMEMIQVGRDRGYYPYFRPISRCHGPEVETDNRRMVMLASNDYLGLSQDPRVVEAAVSAMRRWATGPGGSRFLCGNTTLHEALEERLADLLGKKKALVYTTGFGANLGTLSCLLSPGSYILCDKENHASIFEGARASQARVVPFEHNDIESAEERLSAILKRRPDATVLLVTEGVFSMSGDLAILPQLVRLKEKHPKLYVYLDDAHGLGVMHKQGRGTPAHFGVTSEVDFIMGTFSKAMASIGGFVASDHVELLEYLKHQSRTLIFSAALPAGNVAAALTCLDILEKEPERIERLHRNARRARDGYRQIGLQVPEGETPIVPILIGPEFQAAYFAQEMFNNGIFAVPAMYPAVPRGGALIRTAFMATHEDRHIDFVLETLDGLYRRLRTGADEAMESFLNPAVQSA